MKTVRRNKYFKVFFGLLLAIGIALILVIMGQFSGVGYHVHNVKELSFIRYENYGYADANFTFDATYNPILYPFYWLVGKGRVSGNFSMMYLPHSYQTGEFGPGNYGRSPEDRYEDYISYMSTSGTLANFIILLAVTSAIEILRRRVLYLLPLSGIVGFSAAGVFGTVAGSVVGAFAAVYLLKRGFSFPLVGLRGYIVRRIAYSFILVILIITVDFVIFMRMPGNPTDFLVASTSLGGQDLETTRQQARELWGVNLPLASQYFTYLRNLLTWNFGNIGVPLTRERSVIPLTQSLAAKLPYTIFLLGVATVISVYIGINLGIASVYKRGGKFDSLLAYLSVLMYSFPVFWLGMILRWTFCSGLRWFPAPVGAYPGEWAHSPPIVYTLKSTYSSSTMQMTFNLSLPEVLRLIGGYLEYAFLPLCTLVLSTFGVWVLLTRSSLLQTLGDDYLLTAKAKGLKEWRVLTKHAFRNACLPIVTSAAISFGFVIMGSVFVETVFRYPGIGQWLYQAIWDRDYVILMAVFYVLAICLIVANAIADLLMGLLDPRIRTG